MVTVKSVIKGSPADKKGIAKGDIIISVNGNEIKDVLDYRFYITEKKLDILIHRGPELFSVKISKGEYDDIGLDFETFLMDKKQSCTNKCIFCFIDQLPEGMRDSLYFKDDDSRLSFLMGNYITLTNMSEEDIRRIIKMHMSPINVSVHTTEPELRCRMLNNRFAGDKLKFLSELAGAGISINCQIVLCRGINDGEHLIKTLTDLSLFYPSVSSIAVVPAGLTKHRQGLYPLTQFDAKECREVILTVDRLRAKFRKKYGTGLCCCSDEFYLMAGMPLPDEAYYEGYSQLDNGVGLITSMKDEFYEELEYLDEDYGPSKELDFSVATGYAAHSFIEGITADLCKKRPGLRGKVFRIRNDFFGESITVAGLVCGCDLVSQLEGQELGSVLFIPSVMLRSEGDMFLDSMTVKEAEKRLGVRIIATECTGRGFISAIMNYNN